MRQINIQPATMRDATYVMAYLRPSDEAEVMCQVPAGMRRDHMAYNLLMSGDTFSVRIDDQPIGFFGTSPMNAAVLSVWALGTRHVWRGVPYINRFMSGVHLPEKIAQGYHSMEARSHIDHHDAHRWLEAMGAKQHGPAFEWGRAREMFLLFRWTASDLRGIQAVTSKSPRAQGLKS